MGNILDKTGLKTYTAKVKTAIANAVAEVKLYFTTQKVTWSELKALRDAKKLVAGKTYRITDFVTTTAQADTRSAGHAFDLLVVVDDEGTLNENARAVLHSGDTYFAQSDLSAWRLMYCLDNDDTRFAWADKTNGKGVIFRMIDEWENDVPYDFKNIQFKRYQCTTLIKGDIDFSDYMTSGGDFGTFNSFFAPTLNNDIWNTESAFAWCYTFNNYKNNDTEQPIDMSIPQDINTGIEDKTQYWVNFLARQNRMGVLYSNVQKDDSPIYNVQHLNNIVATCYDVDDAENWGYNVANNTFGEGCHDITIARKCYDITCGNSCFSWTCGNNCGSWTCGNDCNYWTCGNNCGSWTCGNNCHSWTCRNNCYSWTCGNDCNYWTCGNNCGSWTCGDYCNSWTCGNNCHSWTCGNNCHSWTCGNNCHSWTCGNKCHSWTCGNDCHSWTCGNKCHSWTCGNNCHSWTCGDYCHSWTCGNNCYSWTCGNDCNYWTCGNNCYSWTCGNYCDSWTCRNNCYSWTCGNDCNYWTCGNDCGSWTCGNGCSFWTCGNDCHSWTCGNYCFSWTCGNGCSFWTCGNDCNSWTCGNFVDEVSIPQDNVSYFHLASGTSYVNIRSNGTPTSSSRLQNFEVKGGIAGDPDSSRVDIVIPTTDFPLGAQYTWTIAKNSGGEIKQYCEADLIN